VYFLPLILKVTFFLLTALPFLLTTLTENLIFLAFFLEMSLAVNVGLITILLDTLYPLFSAVIL
jgi:hypothetical protein